jgi:hypothetical protein
MTVSANAHLRLLDRPCGSGKTTTMIQSFKPDQRYLVVVPLLTEVERVIEQSAVTFVQPEETKEYGTKEAHLEVLLRKKRNVVTTHALYQNILWLVRMGLLDGYHIIIDEVPDVLEVVGSISKVSLDEFYVGLGYVELEDDGRLRPTKKWREYSDVVSDTLSSKVFNLASLGLLHHFDDEFIIWGYPRELLSAGVSVTVMTYLAEGTLLYRYLLKNNIPFFHDVDPVAAQKARDHALKLVEVRPLPRLKKRKWSYTAQGNCTKAEAKEVADALLGLRRGDLRGVPLDKVLVVCRKDRWFLKGDDHPTKRRQGAFAKGSKLFADTQWVPNTTRGTNDYIYATHMIYLYDQFVNPVYLRFLGISDKTAFNEQYALAELVQVIYRTAVRRGEKVVVYIPCERMRRVFEDYRNLEPAALPIAA